MAKTFMTFNSAERNPEWDSVQDISPHEVLEKKEDLYIVDVRRPDEYTGEYGHIRSAQLVVLDTLPERLDELPKDQTVVFVCRSGGRSARAAAYAQSQGFKHVYNMKGGMMAWDTLGFEAEEKK